MSGTSCSILGYYYYYYYYQVERWHMINKCRAIAARDPLPKQESVPSSLFSEHYGDSSHLTFSIIDFASFFALSLRVSLPSPHTGSHPPSSITRTSNKHPAQGDGKYSVIWKLVTTHTHTHTHTHCDTHTHICMLEPRFDNKHRHTDTDTRHTHTHTHTLEPSFLNKHTHRHTHTHTHTHTHITATAAAVADCRRRIPFPCSFSHFSEPLFTIMTCRYCQKKKKRLCEECGFLVYGRFWSTLFQLLVFTHSLTLRISLPLCRSSNPSLKFHL